MSDFDARDSGEPARAVALQWDRENAPCIIATGSGTTAEEILRIARAHDIPLQQDPVLTEALAQIPLGEEIPPELYVAVAEVLAFVFMLAGIDPRSSAGRSGDQSGD